MTTGKKLKNKSDRTHRATAQQRTSELPAASLTAEPSAATLPTEIQQKILDVFRRAFPFDDDQFDLRAVAQEVKGHLFQRDFARAFSKPEYLEAYALRWSAGRALGYTSIFLHGDLQQVWNSLDIQTNSSDSAAHLNTKSTFLSGKLHSRAGACRVMCIGGGGGAEVVACAAAAQTLLPPSTNMCVQVVDIADWASCLQKLAHASCTPPELSIYASQSAKAANKALVADDEAFDLRFSQQDILEATEIELKEVMQDVHLCTIMFALNELFSASIAKATAFLLELTESISPGSWLLVVDSPGSYSEVKLGTGDATKCKQYPMKWLLDHTLLELTGQGEKCKWKKVVSDDSRWFRLQQQSLKYPIELENMRYQIHLYRRVTDANGGTSSAG